jgi:tRNA(His) guanylyltransferase
MSIKEIFKGIFDKAFNLLSDRMKAYEQVEKKSLESKTPVIIRLDGRAFHTYTRGFEKPFDGNLIAAMKYTTVKLCEEIQNVKIGYSQSDEITLFLSDYESANTQQWFNGNIQKMVSLAASIATYHFNDFMDKHHWNSFPERRRPATFDARVFNLPRHEVVNCFIWRQQDGIRNSISGLAQAHYSDKELHRKSTGQMLEMLLEKGIVWDDLETYKKRGFCVTKEYFVINPAELNLPINVKPPQNVKRSKWVVDNEIPIFTEDKSYIDVLVMIGELEDGK